MTLPEPLATDRGVVLAVCQSGDGSSSSVRNMLGRMPSIGILYLAGALRQRGYKTVTLDRQHSPASPEQLAQEIAAHEPCLVGFTLYDATMQRTDETVRALRRLYRGPVVVGGYTATFHAEEILRQWTGVDYVIVREGETPIVALMEHLGERRPIDAVPNLVYRRNNGIVRNTEGPLEDVKRLPWPVRGPVEPGILTPILARRGCLSRCTFCSMVPFYDTRLGSIVRWRTPVDVAEEIASCIDRGSCYFGFYDDDFGMSSRDEREWCMQFAAEIRRRKLRFVWNIETRVADVVRGRALLPEFCDLGLVHVSVGMESMLPRQLKLYRKGYTQDDIYRAVEILDGLPAEYQTNVIFWDPWSTLPEAAHHIELLDRIRIVDQLATANFPVFGGRLVPRLGTDVHAMLARADRLLPVAGTIGGFTYEFTDDTVSQFWNGPFKDFWRRTRIVRRPPALWLNVPLLEHLGDTRGARILRRYGRTLAQLEFQYFKELLNSFCAEPGTDAGSLAQIHATYGDALERLGDQLLAGLPHAPNPRPRHGRQSAPTEGVAT